MNEAEYVTLAEFWEPSEPLFLKSLLEAHGIEAYVRGEYMGNVLPMLGVFGGQARGGIALQVHAEDAVLAKELLENPPDIENETE